jgi:prepilin-type N-terminal cleavage/methylation domain-containing protein
MRPSRRSASAGFTLIELAIVIALLAVLLSLVGGVLVSLQRCSVDGLARQEAVDRARRATQLLVAELRDLHLTPADLEPDAPFDCADLRYRLVVDHAAGAPVVAPTAASGLFRRVRLVGRRLERVVGSGPPVVLAEVDAVAITLVPPDRLRIKVTVQRRGVDGPVFGIDEVTVLLRNRG